MKQMGDREDTSIAKAHAAWYFRLRWISAAVKTDRGLLERCRCGKLAAGFCCQDNGAQRRSGTRTSNMWKIKFLVLLADYGKANQEVFGVVRCKTTVSSKVVLDM